MFWLRLAINKFLIVNWYRIGPTINKLFLHFRIISLTLTQLLKYCVETPRNTASCKNPRHPAESCSDSGLLGSLCVVVARGMCLFVVCRVACAVSVVHSLGLGAGAEFAHQATSCAL